MVSWRNKKAHLGSLILPWNVLQFSLAICLIVSPSFCISCKNIWQTYEVNIVRGLLAKDRIHQVGILWTAPSAVEWERPLTMARPDWTWFSNIPNAVSFLSGLFGGFGCFEWEEILLNPPWVVCYYTVSNEHKYHGCWHQAAVCAWKVVSNNK